MTNCKAKFDRSAGQMVCNRCGYMWDLDDRKPDCKNGVELFNVGAIKLTKAINNCYPAAQEAMNNIRKVLK